MTAIARTGFRPSAAVDRVRGGSLPIPQPPSSDEVVSLAMGEPGFDTPPGIRLTAHGALEAGYTHYAHPHGDPELRQVLAERLTASTRAAFTAEDVLVTHGGTSGLAAAILAIVDPGDTVVLPDPTYSLYADLVHLAGGRCLPVPLQSDLHWDLDALADALPEAKLFVFCNPSNHGVAVRPGSEFGRAGEHHIRLSFAAEPSAITAGLERIRTGLAHLDHRHPEAHR